MMSLLRKIIISLVVIAIILSSVYGYFYLKKVKVPASNAFKAVPLNAAFIIESKQSKNTWRKLSQSSLIWQDLIENESFKDFHLSCTQIDSLVSAVPEILQLLENNSVLISAHPSGANGYNFLYTLCLPNLTDEKKVEGFVQSSLKARPATVKMYDGVSIATFHLNKDELHYVIYKRMLIFSPSMVLIEDAIRQLNTDASLLNDESFKDVYEASGTKTDAALYINYKNAPAFLKQFTNSEGASQAHLLYDCAAWTELDMNVNPNTLMLNGFTCAYDSLNHYLSVFNGQRPQEITIPAVIPGNTISFLFYGVNDWKDLSEKYNNYLGIKNRLYDRQKFFSGINGKYKTNIEYVMSSWIEKEAGIFMTDDKGMQTHENCFAIFKAKNSQDAMEALGELCDTIARTDSLKRESLNYKGYTIQHLPLKKILSRLWGPLFDKMNNNFFTSVNDHIVFGNSIEALQRLINNIEKGKFLADDAYYKDFFEGHLDAESNIYFYSNISGSADMHSSVLNEEYAGLISKDDTILKKFQGIGMQLSFSKKNLIYTSAFIKYNPSHKKQISTLWETELDAAVATVPQTVINHLTKAKEIVVQDAENNLYLINSTGKILWKRSLTEKIISHVSQVDAFKNNKLQLLFNTSSNIYLIDRNGNDVENFPVKLKFPATNALAVFDYDGNRDYRLLIACEDKNIYNYSVRGEPVSGWKSIHTTETVKLPVQHFAVAGKDYLVSIDIAGNIYTNDRQGSPRPQGPLNIGRITKPFYIEPGKDINKSYILAFDSVEKKLVNLTFKNEKSGMKFSDLSSYMGFVRSDINQDKTIEYLFASPEKLFVWNSDETELFSYEFKSNIIPLPLVFTFPRKGAYIGVVSPSGNEIFLFNGKGELHPDFPIEGSTLFCLEDLNNDGIFYLIAGRTDNRLFVYQIE